jgi:hypothetical protein
MQNNKFFCVVEFHCINCREFFKCDSKKINHLICNLCNLNHSKCKNENCLNCCYLNKCNDIECSFCLQHNIKCERTLPTSQKKFNEINNLQYFVGQFERTSEGRLHIQGYCQTKNSLKHTLILKNIFNCKTLYVSRIWGSFFSATNYCKAEYFYKKGKYNNLTYKNLKLDKNNKKIQKRILGTNYFEFGIPEIHDNYKKKT